ncbi:ricin-type beta-trefoil lectin domain protein [Streptomyces sp. NBC_01724]|uniref:RICIN domain-containing protein n=1 Tax=unclassified Streptomyces TaxID=2593676 RepID=UPI002E2F19AA|nr:ricin-type beta-trefoil lectin domain protein [Streptomyces sp. NBC_01724]WTE56726.1 ricin-type beta-trefoil lectin domain protein [Streptomyces sp. NBC_01620]WTE57320.1 ricin-type beta-trefoil lectin domain protein [Streptomyces sp. NBC_01617]WTE64808.1 ricin-type beta-trefoil lectin domain protein [Streptomyces sp. NBC_01617]
MLKKVAAIGAASAALCWGLGTAPAQAAGMAYQHVGSAAYDLDDCLDYRADYGPYTTGCNGGAYQTWLMVDALETLTEIRQNVGDKLCLVARNGKPTMRQCLADDPAALWTVHNIDARGGYQLINNATKTCLVAGSGTIHRVTLNTCEGGLSRLWAPFYA